MAEFAPGMRVRIRGEEWIVNKAEKNTLGNNALHCTGVTPLVKDRQAIFLEDLETVERVDPARVRLVADSSPGYGRALLYIESQWRQRIPTDGKLHIGHRAVMDAMPYQLEPAAQALSRPRQRILIADSVGLGKTLEAGILMSELIARGKGRRILVVTVKSMMTQFQQEMWNRFTIPLVRLDSQRIHRIREELPSNYNPFFYYDRTIISVDTLKRDLEYRTHLESAYWDIIVIDEAQNVAERGDGRTQRARLAKLLAERSDSLILLSATPHDGRPRSFASLMNMLDPTAIADPDRYTRENIEGLYIRRFKKDIDEQARSNFKERTVTKERCPASPAEERAYDVFAGTELEMDRDRRGRAGGKGAGHLFKTGLEKAMFSSPAACIQTIDNRLKKLEKKHGESGTGDIQKLRALREALAGIAPESFSRYCRLVELLKSPEYGWTRGKGDRVVIFTERIETMKFLKEHLCRDLGLKDSAVETMSGDMPDSRQQEIVERFGRTESEVRVLVASDVASEGLNLHHCCHRLIHFDIPWSLMVFQQRNGRVDRYGQKARPDIRFLCTECENGKVRGDARVLERLIDKEKAAHDNIGDPGLLMGLSSAEEEEEKVAGAIEELEEDGFGDFEDILEGLFPGDDSLGGILGSDSAERRAVTAEERTLYSDTDYLERAMRRLSQSEPGCGAEKLEGAEGLRVSMSPALRRRMRAVMPEGAMPEAGMPLCLSPDREFCMREMAQSRQGGMGEGDWPRTQYLWKQHPVLAWADERIGSAFARDEAPLLALHGRLRPGETVFLFSGSMPNKRSAPLVDAWFAVSFVSGIFRGTEPMESAVRRAGLRSAGLINAGNVGKEQMEEAEILLEDAVEEAKKYMESEYAAYKERTDRSIQEELEKLGRLQEEHKAKAQLSLFGKEGERVAESKRQREERERRERAIDDLFERYVSWVTDNMEIENSPYIRIVAVLMEV